MEKIIFLFLPFIFFCQNNERKFISEKHNLNGHEIEVSDGKYFIHFKTESIVETTFIPKGEVINTDSHAVIYPNKIAHSFSKKDNEFSINGKYLEVHVQKNPFQISYKKSGKEIISEKLGYIRKDSSEVLQFNLKLDEVLYGGGARVLGMNRRGNRLQLYNKAHYGYENRSELMNYTLPIVISSDKYMIHFDNAPIGYLDLDSKKDNTLEYETISGRKTYHVIVGESWGELISNYTKLTGKQPMPPKWAFGNLASRFGYHSEKQVYKTIQKYKKDKIPIDGIILDLYWFGKDIKGTMGNLEIFRDSFPNFEKMVKDLNKENVKTITITEPFILKSSKKWNEAVSNQILTTLKDGSPAIWDFYFGTTGLIDVFKPEAKKWFWDIYKNMANKGVSGVWGDLGEPEVFPSFANSVAGKADEVHNIYGHQWAKLVYEGYQKDFPNQRPFILMRSGAAGSQRFGMLPWSGDVNRTWGGLSGQIEIALQMGMQGLAYMHSDLGGFAGANLDDELYARWLQYGVFNPIFRPHGQEEVPSEPVFRSEKAKDLAKKAIELRYKFFHYNYTLAHQNSLKGLPLMRPLFFEEETNPELQSKADGYLWGNDVLVYPVMEKGQKTKSIYFPKSSSWFDYYTVKKYEGGIKTSVSLSDEYIPTFVRANVGLIQNKVSTSISKIKSSLDFIFFFDKKDFTTQNEVYFDNGYPVTSKLFSKEKYIIKNKCIKNQLKIEITPEIFKKNQQLKKVSYVIHNVLIKPKSLLVNNKKVLFRYEQNKIYIQFKTENKRATLLTINL